jgi:hypothetical protein
MLIGPEVRDVKSVLDAAAIPVGAGATVWSRSFSLRFGKYFALAYLAGSAGAVDLTIQLEQSFYPLTEAEEGLTNAKYVIPESLPDIHTNLADTLWHNKSFSPVAMPYGRLKITSAAGVANTLTPKLSVQEEV